VTVSELLDGAAARLRAAGVESARLDAELLLAMALGVDRSVVIAHHHAPVGVGQADRFEEAVRQRLGGQPVAYIRGVREFYGLAFAVDRRALIPRPETELIVDLALGEIAERLTSRPRATGAPALRVVDVGTGSGAIAVSLAVTLRRRGMAGEVELLAVDISEDALDVARENAVGHGVADLIRFAAADLLPPPEDGRAWDVCCANLPYIANDELASLPEVGAEPALALDGGGDGLDVVRRLLDRLGSALAVDGVALLEIGATQGEAALAAARRALPGRDATVLPDLAGRTRVLRIGAAVQAAGSPPQCR